MKGESEMMYALFVMDNFGNENFNGFSNDLEVLKDYGFKLMFETDSTGFVVRACDVIAPQGVFDLNRHGVEFFRYEEDM